jgi:hypothetical protein
MDSARRADAFKSSRTVRIQQGFLCCASSPHTSLTSMPYSEMGLREHGALLEAVSFTRCASPAIDLPRARHSLSSCMAHHEQATRTWGRVRARTVTCSSIARHHAVRFIRLTSSAEGKRQRGQLGTRRDGVRRHAVRQPAGMRGLGASAAPHGSCVVVLHATTLWNRQGT